MPSRLRIGTKLTVLLLGFAALVLAGLGSFAYYTGRSALLDATRAALLSSAIEKEAALDYWAWDRQEEIATIAKMAAWADLAEDLEGLASVPADSPGAQGLGDGLRRHLTPWVGDKGGFHSMMIIEPVHGKAIVSTRQADLGTFKENRPYFINGLKAPYLQNPYFSISLQAPATVVSTPIALPDGTALGVLAGRLRMEEMDAIVGRRTGLHESDDAYLVNAAHLLVTQPRLVDDPAVLARGIYSPAVDVCAAGVNGSVLARDFRGVPVVSVYRWLAARGLCLVVKISQEEAFKASRDLGWAILAGAVLVLLAAGLAASWLVRTITRPILALQAGTAAVGRGNLHVRLATATGDELGQLARDFNAMTEALATKDAQIQQYAGKLEARVEERTAELHQANEALVRKERLAALGQLTATVAHELRNPLGTIRTSFAVVELKIGTAEGQLKRALDRIERNIGRCNRIITELLDFTRVRDLEPASTPLDPWLADFFREYDVPPKVALRREQRAPDAFVSIDNEQFRRALVNVVENACQAMRGDDDARAGGRLTVATRDTGQRVEIAITDTGPGMPADVMARIFEPLYSTKGFRVGLGLPTVKQIMERHGGGIEFASQEGAGTQTVLWLPHCPNGEGVPS